MNKIAKITFNILILGVLSACSTSHELDIRVSQENYKHVALPEDNKEEPFRFWANEQPDFLYDTELETSPLNVSGERLNILALSGGGANGAFGAGVILGLRDKGSLEDYSVITGISAGALIAPFVFSGEDELDRLKEVMLDIDDSSVLGRKNFLNTLFKDSFAKGSKLMSFIKESYPDSMIDKIAVAHSEGRRLFIGTTHFDSGELMIWNIGAIANSSLPNKADLIHQVLAASASIPGVFPPQFVEVYDGGNKLEELHVDGGLSAQVFFNPSNFDYSKISKSLGLNEAPQLHVIRNGLLTPQYKPVKDKGVDLLTKSLSSLTVLQAKGDMYRMKYFSEVGKIDMQFTYIDEDFSNEKLTRNMFDENYMRSIYLYGYQRAMTDQLWETELP